MKSISVGAQSAKRVVVTMALLAVPAIASAQVYKCGSGPSVGYQDRPCSTEEKESVVSADATAALRNTYAWKRLNQLAAGGAPPRCGNISRVVSDAMGGLPAYFRIGSVCEIAYPQFGMGAIPEAAEKLIERQRTSASEQALLTRSCLLNPSDLKRRIEDAQAVRAFEEKMRGLPVAQRQQDQATLNANAQLRSEYQRWYSFRRDCHLLYRDLLPGRSRGTVEETMGTPFDRGPGS